MQGSGQILLHYTSNMKTPEILSHNCGCPNRNQTRDSPQICKRTANQSTAISSVCFCLQCKHHFTDQIHSSVYWNIAFRKWMQLKITSIVF